MGREKRREGRRKEGKGEKGRGEPLSPIFWYRTAPAFRGARAT